MSVIEKCLTRLGVFVSARNLYNDPAAESRLLMIAPARFAPVQIALHGNGKFRSAETVEDAAECILTLWPVSDGAAFWSAQEVFLEALRGDKTPYEARKALVAAAYEAGISVIE